VEKSFSIEALDNEVILNFESRTDLKAIRQLEFSSRLMHGLVPDSNNIWRPGRRSDYHIVGFPPGVFWRPGSNNILIGKALETFRITEAYVAELSSTIEGICGVTADEGAKYVFSVTDGKSQTNYEFHSRARTICALAVLYDLEWHPRKDLEIWINPDYTDKLPPGELPDHGRPEEQYYGDPSKTADVLRNEGWTREATTPFMFVEARQVGRQSQQHYRITQIEQPLENQVMRTNIKAAWRNTLFESQDFTCQICLNDYRDAPDQLSPDHRIPVVFESDNLADENYLTKLMTLCRFCNQAKREFTKRLRFDYDWTTSPWSFPEKYRLQIIERQIEAILKGAGRNSDSLLQEVMSNLAEFLK
jgi:5-methylcytosine-specific restriction endonuclease McrA